MTDQSCARCHLGPRFDRPLLRCRSCLSSYHPSCSAPPGSGQALVIVNYQASWFCWQCPPPSGETSRHDPNPGSLSASRSLGAYSAYHPARAMPSAAAPLSNILGPLTTSVATETSCQVVGCFGTAERGRNHCSKHLPPRQQAVSTPPPGPALPVNSRLGAEFSERSGKTARKGARHHSAQPHRPTAQNSDSLPRAAAQRPIEPRRLPTPLPSSAEYPRHRSGSTSSTLASTNSPALAPSLLRRTTPTIPPPTTNGIRRIGSSPLKTVQMPPDTGRPLERLSTDKMREMGVEASQWYDQHGAALERARGGPIEIPPQYDPRLLVPQLVVSDFLPRRQEQVLVLQKTLGEKSLYKTTLNAAHSSGPSSVPAASPGPVKGSPADSVSRKRPSSPEPQTHGSLTPDQPYPPPHSRADLYGTPLHKRGRESASQAQRGADVRFDMNGHAGMLPHKTAAHLTGGQMRSKHAGNFDQGEFDAVFYGQEGAGLPPPGVVPAKREPAPPVGEDGRLYLRLDPRIHWPRDWSEEWYADKMKEIKARGNRKANWGQAPKRMREQRMKAEASAAEEQEATAAGSPMRRRREPHPWAHRRHIDFGDVPEESLPWVVRADPAWLRACAWMRTNRTKEAQREVEVKRAKANGSSVQHLVGRTGW